MSEARNNLALATTLPSSLMDAIRRWFSLWGLAGLEQSIKISFSSRIHRVLGRCYAKRRRINIAARVRQMPLSILEEVVCHECAHLAAVQLYGENCRPHGREWAQLVRSAGFEPHRRLLLDGNDISTPSRRRSCVYVHFCPVCQTERVGRRAVRTWRCADCRALGLDGLLEIRRYPLQEEIEP
jgi:predicted SprT family Zn-dependent metalloprotease